jgi:hypothetical protein
MPHSTLLLLLLFFVAACGDQVQKAKPPEKPAPETAMPPDHPVIGHGATRPTAGDPFNDSGSPDKPAMGKASPADPERIVYSGEIAIDPSVPLPAQYVVYLVTIYDPKERVGVLIRRFETPKFPFAFELREKDAIMGSRSSDKPLYLRAMISDTGDVMKSRNKTTSDQAYAPFTKDIKLTIKP